MQTIAVKIILNNKITAFNNTQYFLHFQFMKIDILMCLFLNSSVLFRSKETHLCLSSSQH